MIQSHKRKITNLTVDEETIIALTSPRGSGAIAILRLSGLDAVEISNKFSELSSKKSLINVDTHTIHHGFVINPDVSQEILNAKYRIDEVLFFVMRGPKTFTGQDTVEISCHNNQFIIEKIIIIACDCGARLAKPGEFTRRAFLNDKIDLIQAEAINDVIHSQTEVALKKAQAQLSGSLSSFIKKIEDQLVELLSYVEASFEFLEEEQRDLDFEGLIKSKIDKFLLILKEIENSFHWQKQIRDGIRIAIIGTVNAGKSSLFNSLLKKDRAIVSPIEGTTRDVVESSVYRNGSFWTFVDTAGIRKTKDLIEKEGVRRSLNEAGLADVILLVWDSSILQSKDLIYVYREIIQKYKDKIIFVFSKVDSSKTSNVSFNSDQILNKLGFPSGSIETSVNQGKGIDLLESEIDEKIQKIFSKFNSPFLLNQRQFDLIKDIKKNIDIVAQDMSRSVELELVAYNLKECLEKISELTGRGVTEKVLDHIFNSFCVGK